MGKETALPKNIRQIGDIQGKEKICIEDYVMTYIRKKEPQEEKGFLGVFLGERQKTEDADYTFIRGILEIEQEEEEEKLRESFEKERSGSFPGWEVMGCCIIGVYPTKRLELLTAIAPEAQRLIYHLQEQEETIYLKEQENYRKMPGYLVFYEQNQRMQDYLAETFGKDSVEKESAPDKAIKSFRQKVKEKGEQKNHNLLKLASSFFVITVLAIGAIAVNRLDEIRTVGSNAGRAGVSENGQSGAGGSVVQYKAQDADGTTAQSAAAGSVLQNTAGGAAQTSENALQNTVGGAAQTSGSTVQNEAGAATQDTGETGTGAQGAGKGEAAGENANVSDGGATAQSTGAAADDSWMNGSDSFWEEDNGEDGQQGTATETGEAGAGAGEDTAQGAAESENSEAVSRQTQAAYVIKAGDTLANICKKYYGNMDRLEEICDTNNITDANLILPGQKIVLP